MGKEQKSRRELHLEEQELKRLHKTVSVIWAHLCRSLDNEVLKKTRISPNGKNFMVICSHHLCPFSVHLSPSANIFLLKATVDSHIKDAREPRHNDEPIKIANLYPD